MNSRDRFSFGAAAVLLSPSSQRSIAASVSMASASVRKSPRPSRLSVSFCRLIRPASRTLRTEVAKCACQPKVSFSPKGSSTAAIRCTHQVASAVACSRRAFWAALRDAAPAALPTGSSGGNDGTGVRSAPGSRSGSAARTARTCASLPVRSTASTWLPVVPKPVRRSSRAVASHSLMVLSLRRLCARCVRPVPGSWKNPGPLRRQGRQRGPARLPEGGGPKRSPLPG